MTERRHQFDRSLLPSIDVYLGSINIAVPDRGVQRRCDCPLQAHSSKRPFCINVDTGAWWCHACGVGGGDSLALHQAITGQMFLEAADELGALVAEIDDQRRSPRPAPPPRPAPNPAQEQERIRKVRTARETWQRTVPLEGTAGEDYLRGRGCRLPPAEGDLRFLPSLEMFGLCGCWLAGRISRAEDASIGTGLHLTLLHRVEGRWQRSERRYLGQKAGGVVRLWPDEAVTAGVAVAEGIETSLAAAHAYAPIWACMDAGNLAVFPVQAGIESLTIFADRDASGTGQKAAAACADRWLDAGKEVLVMLPATVGADVADEVTS